MEFIFQYMGRAYSISQINREELGWYTKKWKKCSNAIMFQGTDLSQIWR